MNSHAIPLVFVTFEISYRISSLVSFAHGDIFNFRPIMFKSGGKQ